MNKLKVKVIKKENVGVQTERPVSGSKSKKIAAREMVSTVTNWVSDFQQRKRDDTKLAIDKFLTMPTPNES
ncbi:MAG: hypothetical protein WBD22_13105 [Pyrinomonadaceae bacterium]